MMGEQYDRFEVGIENVPGNHFFHTFGLPPFSQDERYNHKDRPINMLPSTLSLSLCLDIAVTK